jgi:hypothetical protein
MGFVAAPDPFPFKPLKALQCLRPKIAITDSFPSPSNVIASQLATITKSRVCLTEFHRLRLETSRHTLPRPSRRCRLLRSRESLAANEAQEAERTAIYQGRRRNRPSRPRSIYEASLQESRRENREGYRCQIW